MSFLFGAVLSIFLAVAGIILCYLNNETHKPNFIGGTNFETKQLLVGEITDITPTAAHTRLTLATHYLVSEKSDSISGQLQTISGNLLVYVPADSIEKSSEKFKIGANVEVKCKPQIISSLHNPFEFDFAQYWHYKNAHYQCFVASTDVVCLPSPPIKSIRVIASVLQKTLVGWLQPYLPTPESNYVGMALMLGAKSTEAEEIKNAYIQTGAMHILAVSGMHVMLIWLAIKRLTAVFIKNKKRQVHISTLFGLITVWVFACVTGLGASVLRATVMASFLGLGELTNRKGNAINMLAASAFVLLVADPFMLFDIGFQFSYLAICGIVMWYPIIFKMIPTQNKIVKFFWEITALGLAAQIFVTPLSLLYFHRFPTYFWLTGLLAIPVSTVALYAGLLVFIFHPIPPLAWFAGKIFSISIALMNTIILKTENLPYNAIGGIYPNTPTVVLAYLFATFVLWALHNKKLRAWYPALYILLLLTSLSAFKSQFNPQITICIYNIPRKSVIDIFSEKTCLSINTIDTTNMREMKQQERATQNFRIYKGVSKIINVGPDDSAKIAGIGFMHKAIIGSPERWLIISDPIRNYRQIFIENIILSGNAEVSIDSLERYFSPKRIILDPAIKPAVAEKYTADCKRLNLFSFDVRNQGAFITNF